MRRRTWTLLLFLLAPLACSERAGGPIEAYASPLRSDAELSSAFEALCHEATEPTPRPVLVEFSAEWCGDCQRLNTMKQSTELAGELAHWPQLTVNVGRFDRHPELLAALDVESIAHWTILRPTDCTLPASRWPRAAERTLEVASGAARGLSPADLARWLAEMRNTRS